MIVYRSPGIYGGDVADDPTVRARQLFLTEENTYGCAETTLVVLQEHYGLANAGDSSPAMALNGGIAYSGGTCGAITGAALAIGRLSEQRIADHREAKRVARTIVQGLMAQFEARYGTVQCRDLTGMDLLADHDAFLESDIWRTRCMAQIEFAVRRVAGLTDGDSWAAELERLGLAGVPSPDSGGTEPDPAT
jgi:C_GCAxxG_C_C family probable redox protein